MASDEAKEAGKNEKGADGASVERLPVPIKVIKKVVESPFAKEFAEFINRGSMVDLAIGVAVGGAFTTIVKSLVDDIVMPIASLLAGGLDFSTLAIDVPNVFGADSTAHIAYGNFLQNVVNFLAIAFTVFLIMRTINRFNAKRLVQLKGELNEAERVEEKKTERKGD